MDRAEDVISRLLAHYQRRWRPRRGDPFRSLVRIILSQNTGYRNEAMAYEQLEETIGVTPDRLAKAPVNRIADAIRPAGMYNQRSGVLKEVAKVVLERYGGDIAPILSKTYAEARLEFMELPGVGPKTADVLLMFEAGKAVIPVDRHISRIAKRLGFVSPKAGYEDIRHALEAAAAPDMYEDVHVFLIRFGREVCRARHPRCGNCFLSDLCPYPGRESSGVQTT